MGRIHAHSCREPNLYRWWISDRKRDYRTLAKGEISWRARLTGIWIGLDDEEPLIDFSLGLYWLYLHLSVRGPRFIMQGEDWEVFQLSFHGGTMWWRIWHSNMGWSSRTPRWRCGNWSPADTLLGKVTHAERVIEERQVLVPMPEKSYPATVKLIERTDKRPRWFKHVWTQADINIPGGIPHAGKGTAEWNCGDDATFGLYTAARTIPEAVGKCVGSCLESRVRYGGWDDYVWKREVLK
jgi:hypothetical protein